MKALVWAANLLGWPIIQIAIGGAVLRWPSAAFMQDSWLTRERQFERNGDLYRRLFAIQRWKKHLPDGAPWLGGMPKKRLAGRSSDYFESLIIESRRAELSHWCMLLCFPLFFFWNPPWASAIMACYGLAANLPCIAAQRANRIQLSRMVRRRRSRTWACANPVVAEPAPSNRAGRYMQSAGENAGM
jgi:glycosyl-4,4'-diaponeurosporenoate acyltransferase